MCYSQIRDLKIGHRELKVKKKERDKVAINNLILQCFSSLDFKYVGRNTARKESVFLRIILHGKYFQIENFSIKKTLQIYKVWSPWLIIS